jgi:hypothetical protein
MSLPRPEGPGKLKVKDKPWEATQMLLIDDLLFAPFSGWNFIMRTLMKVAEEQWTDDAPLKEQLLHLQVELEEGSITEEQYLEAEAAILREIREVQRRKIELAGGDPDQFESGISGSAVQEGSGASITWDPNESNEE